MIMFNLFKKREKKMGGENESLLKAEKGTPAAAGGTPMTVLRPDVPPTPAPANTVAAMQHQGVAPQQTQTIRQHMNAGQVHLHCDEQHLKAAIPVAEWYVIMRQLR